MPINTYTHLFNCNNIIKTYKELLEGVEDLTSNTPLPYSKIHKQRKHYIILNSTAVLYMLLPHTLHDQCPNISLD